MWGLGTVLKYGAFARTLTTIKPPYEVSGSLQRGNGFDYNDPQESTPWIHTWFIIKLGAFLVLVLLCR